MSNVAGRTIWTGDSLDILRGLNSASVDLIYLPPPFISNRNYTAPVGSAAAFKDTWTPSDLHVVMSISVYLATALARLKAHDDVLDLYIR